MKRILLSACLLIAGTPLLIAQDVKEKKAENLEAKKKAEKDAMDNMEAKRKAEKFSVERDMNDRLKDNDEIIIKKKTEKDSKIVIEIKEGTVTINGKPIEDYEDEDVSVRLRTRPEVYFEVPGSRFRTMNDFNGASGVTVFGDGVGADNLVFTTTNKAFLGVSSEETNEGARITHVTEKSAAEKAGLKEDDIITGINDIKISGPNDLTKAIGKFKPEEKITVTYKREGKENKVTATLGKNTTTGFSTARGFSTTSPKVFMSPRAASPNVNIDGFNYNFKGAEDALALANVYGRPRLGIKAQDLEEGNGVKVLEVTKESPAAKAGIKTGDIITSFDETEIENADELAEKAMEAANKAVVKVKITRDGKPQTIEIKTPKKLKTANL